MHGVDQGTSCLQGEKGGGGCSGISDPSMHIYNIYYIYRERPRGSRAAALRRNNRGGEQRHTRGSRHGPRGVTGGWQRAPAPESVRERSLFGPAHALTLLLGSSLSCTSLCCCNTIARAPVVHAPRPEARCPVSWLCLTVAPGTVTLREGPPSMRLVPLVAPPVHLTLSLSLSLSPSAPPHRSLALSPSSPICRCLILPDRTSYSDRASSLLPIPPVLRACRVAARPVRLWAP